jgi:hypothetical protein
MPDHRFLKLYISPQDAQLHNQSLTETEMNVSNILLAAVENKSNEPYKNSEYYLA